MRSSPLLLLFAACACAFRVRQSAKFGANSSESASLCGSCDPLYGKMFAEAWNALSSIGASDTAVGHERGTCCRTTQRFSHVPESVDLYSASKMVSSYTILKLVDEGLLSLDTKAADVLDYWTATDSRKDVTVRHLLSQTSGAGWYPLGFAQCTDGLLTGNGTRLCAKQAYERCFPRSFTPGEKFKYTESTFFMVSAIALEVTGLQYWDDVFQKYLAEPLGINPSKCRYNMPSFSMAFAGGGLRCTTEDYSKILQAILAKTLYRDTTLYDEAERPHTLDNPPQCTPAFCMPSWDDAGTDWRPLMASEPTKGDTAVATAEPNATSGFTWHYGLGQWVECATPKCEGGTLRTSSIGAMGTYPWMDRGQLTGHRPHWGIVVRMFPVNNWGIEKIREQVIPIAAATVQ